MQPTREQKVTLNDLLDRVLDKGLVLNADILISVGGVPLIGVYLSAAIAGVETMKKYGLDSQWGNEVVKRRNKIIEKENFEESNERG
ncbi:MAG: gas vesicle protein [Negativicutes bacterium]